MTDDPTHSTPTDPCPALGDLDVLLGPIDAVGAHAPRRPRAMLPHQLVRLEALLGQLRRQALRLRACRLGLRLVQGGLAP